MRSSEGGDKVHGLIITDHDAPGELLVGEGGDVEPVLGQLAQLVPLPLPHSHLGAPNIGPLFAWGFNVKIQNLVFTICYLLSYSDPISCSSRRPRSSPCKHWPDTRSCSASGTRSRPRSAPAATRWRPATPRRSRCPPCWGEQRYYYLFLNWKKCLTSNKFSSQVQRGPRYSVRLLTISQSFLHSAAMRRLMRYLVSPRDFIRKTGAKWWSRVCLGVVLVHAIHPAHFNYEENVILCWLLVSAIVIHWMGDDHWSDHAC